MFRQILEKRYSDMIKYDYMIKFFAPSFVNQSDLLTRLTPTQTYDQI